MGIVVVIAVNVVLIYTAFQIAKTIWSEWTLPILEEVFSWFGIEDETVVSVERVTSKVMGNETGDPLAKAKSRAMLTWLKGSESFWKVVTREIIAPTYQIKGYYKYAEQGYYVHGLPEMTVRGTTLDNAVINASLNTAVGGTNTVLTTNTTFTLEEIYFKNDLQSAPTNYKPGLDTLTYSDEWGNSWDDWYWDGVAFIPGPDNYEITVSRLAAVAVFWIEGPASVVEGSSVSFVCRSNRIVPAGQSVTLNFSYSGTLAGTEYTPIASVVMLENTDFITLDVPITEDAISEVAETLTVTLDSVTNTLGAFEAVSVGVSNSHTVNVFDNEGLLLHMNSVLVNEVETSVTIPVTLTEAATAPFTVDYNFTDITAVGGVDYDNTPGTLNFTGTAGEIQNITIPLTPDVVTGAREEFTVYLTNCSDVLVDISISAVVTIVDTDVGHPPQGTITYSQIITKPNYIVTRDLVLTYHADTDPATDWYYWVYDLSSGVYPGIDPTFSVLQGIKMIPVTILRSNRVSISSNKASEEYRTARLMALRLGMRIEDIIDAVEATKDGGGNSNLNQIKDVFLNFSVNPIDTGNAISKILWITFYEIVVTHGILSNDNKYSALFREGSVNNALVWIAHSHTTGNVGSVTDVEKYTHSIVGNILKIQYQYDVNLYEEITVTDLSAMTAIDYGVHHEVAFTKIGENNFTIPLSWSVIQQLSKEEVLIAFKDIFRLDMYAISVTELEWYETSAFWDLMEVVSIIITVISLGTASGYAAIIAQLARIATTYLVFQMVIYIADVTGNAELAAIIGIIAMVVLGKSTGMPPMDFATAEGLTTAVTQFSQVVGAAAQGEMQYMKRDIDNLLGEFNEVMEEYKDYKGTPLISGIEYASIESVDTRIMSGIGLQYEFDTALGGNYDRLVSNYHENLLRVGVI